MLQAVASLLSVTLHSLEILLPLCNLDNSFDSWLQEQRQLEASRAPLNESPLIR